MQMELQHTRMCAHIHSLRNMRAFDLRALSDACTYTCGEGSAQIVLVLARLLDIKRER